MLANVQEATAPDATAVPPGAPAAPAGAADPNAPAEPPPDAGPAALVEQIGRDIAVVKQRLGVSP